MENENMKKCLKLGVPKMPKVEKEKTVIDSSCLIPHASCLRPILKIKSKQK